MERQDCNFDIACLAEVKKIGRQNLISRKERLGFLTNLKFVEHKI